MDAKHDFNKLLSTHVFLIIYLESVDNQNIQAINDKFKIKSSEFESSAATHCYILSLSLVPRSANTCLSVQQLTFV